jgi:MFS family permease
MFNNDALPKKPKTYFYLITFAYAFSIFASGILMPIYAFFVQKIGGSILETSWAIGIYSIINGCTTIALHRTRWIHSHRLTCLWVGWLLWVLSIAIYSIMSTIVVLYISQTLNGIGTALSEPIFDAEFAEKVKDDPDRGWSFFEGIINIFYGAAALVGGVVAVWHGFAVLLYIVFGIATLSFFMIAYYTYVTQHTR